MEILGFELVLITLKCRIPNLISELQFLKNFLLSVFQSTKTYDPLSVCAADGKTAFAPHREYHRKNFANKKPSDPDYLRPPLHGVPRLVRADPGDPLEDPEGKPTVLKLVYGQVFTQRRTTRPIR